MYVIPGKKVRQATIEKKLIKIFADRKIKYHEDELKSVAGQLYKINCLLLKRKGVRAECVKEPSGNLDTGNHYFEIEFIDGGEFQTFWPQNEQVAKYFGMSVNNRMRHLRKYLFGSGAIGMSRQLSATDQFFNRLKDITGTYAQL